MASFCSFKKKWNWTKWSKSTKPIFKISKRSNTYKWRSCRSKCKAIFLTTSLESFDTSLYFFRAIDVVNKNTEVSAFYRYYANFLKPISGVCNYESLTYAILAEQAQKKDIPGNGWGKKAELIEESAEDLRRKLLYHNHYVYSQHQEHQLFGIPIEELMQRQIRNFGTITLLEERNGLEQLPEYIKKTSQKIYVPEPRYFVTNSSD